MTKQEHKSNKVTEEALEKKLWSMADLIRDGFGLENADLHKVALPLIVLKRILDLREDYITNHYQSADLVKSGKITVRQLHMSEKPKANKLHLTKDDSLFFVTWDDILNFKDSNGNDKELSLSIDKNIKIKTSAKNQKEFSKEVCNSFNHKVIKAVLIDSDFFKTFVDDGKKVSNKNLMDLINDISDTYFGDNISEDVFSKAYMYLIAKFAGGAGKSGGEFFTPDEICSLVVKCMDISMPEKGELKIGDITGGSATFIITAARELAKGDVSKLHRIETYMQEKVESSLLMGEVGLLLSGIELLNVYHANTITDYSANIGTARKTLDIVVGNPPYGLKDYGVAFATEHSDKEQRWGYGVPKKGEGEYAFMQTALDMIHDQGKVGLVLPLGTLFKDSTKSIRELMLKDDIVEGVIVLPGNMFQTTGIPTCIWVFNKDKKEADKGKVFMIDTTNHAWKDGKYNTIDYNKVVEQFHGKNDEEGFSGYVDIKDIKENDWNLSVQRYIFKDTPEEVIDIVELVSEIKELKKDISKKEAAMEDVFSQILALEEGE